MTKKTCGVRGAALLMVLCACDSDLPSYHRLDRLRILAISAEPPWAQANEVVQVSALVTAPGEGPIDYRWSYCPVDSGVAAEHRCSDPLEAPWPPTDLGSKTTAELALPSRSSIEARCATSDCPDGQLTLFVRLEVETAAERLVGLREVVVDLNARRHTSPGIETVRASSGENAWTLDPSSHAVLPHEDLRLELWPTPGSAEPREDGVERLTVSWFVDAGELGSDRSRPETLDAPATNVWMRAEEAPSQASLHIVLRDDRGGTAWTSFSVRY